MLQNHHDSRFITLIYSRGAYRRPVTIEQQYEPPDAQAPSVFTVRLYITTPWGDEIDIFRVESTRAGCYTERRYLPTGHPNRREYDDQFHAPQDVVAYLDAERRWDQFIAEFQATHGLPPHVDPGYPHTP